MLNLAISETPPDLRIVLPETAPAQLMAPFTEVKRSAPEDVGVAARGLRPVVKVEREPWPRTVSRQTTAPEARPLGSLWRRPPLASSFYSRPSAGGDSRPRHGFPAPSCPGKV